MTIKFYKTPVDLQVIESIKDKIKKLKPRRIKKLKDIGKPFKIELEDLIIFFFLNLPVNQFDKSLEEVLPELSLNRMEKEKLLQILGKNKDFQQFISLKKSFDSEDESVFVKELLVPSIYSSLTEADKKKYSQAVIYLYTRFCPIHFDWMKR